MGTDAATAAGKPKSRLRWYRLTPDRLLIALLPIEGLLLLSERFRWFPFNEHQHSRDLAQRCVRNVG